MAWGGFLNKDGSKYYRILREAEKVVDFLDNLKKYLSDQDKSQIEKTIDIITDHINSLSNGKIEDL